MSTPHNEAAKGSIAKTVLMPGDPRRSEFIAETFLENRKLVNDVRGVHGYTGTWKGVPVTVMASGMGIPSIGIYSWELYSEYDVENIIRVGSAGALQDNLKLMDVILAQGACTTSSYIDNFKIKGTFAPIANFELLLAAKNAAKELGIDVNVTYPIETCNGIPTVFMSSGAESISDIFEEEIEESVPFFTEKGNKDYRNVSARGIMFYEPKRGRKNAKAV